MAKLNASLVYSGTILVYEIPFNNYPYLHDNIFTGKRLKSRKLVYPIIQTEKL